MATRVDGCRNQTPRTGGIARATLDGMRVRIACAALALALGCKAKNERQAEQKPGSTPTTGGDQLSRSSPPPGPAPGTNEARPLAGADVAGPRRKDAPASEPAPTTPTPAKPDELAPAVASTAAGETKATPWPESPPPRGRPDPVVEVARIEGPASAEVEAKLRGAYRVEIGRCYRARLAKDAAAKGTAKLTFSVDAKGAVSAPAATSFAPALDACLAATAGRWRFRAGPPARYAVELAFRPG